MIQTCLSDKINSLQDFLTAEDFQNRVKTELNDSGMTDPSFERSEVNPNSNEHPDSQGNSQYTGIFMGHFRNEDNCNLLEFSVTLYFKVVEQNESEDVIELISNNQFQGIYIGQSFQ